jgi:hypothetical protein
MREKSSLKTEKILHSSAFIAMASIKPPPLAFSRPFAEQLLSSGEKNNAELDLLCFFEEPLCEEQEEGEEWEVD